MAHRKAASSTRLGSILGWTLLVFALCLLSGIIGSAVTRSFGESSYTISYADFISVILTALSVMLTVLGIFLAVLAFVGWRSITTTVEKRTEAFLDEGFEDGNPLHDLVLTRTREIMYAGILNIESENWV